MMQIKFYKKWLYMAPIGLVVFAFGACLVAEAAMTKYGGAPLFEWIAYGTFALIVLNSGLCVFGGAILNRARFEREHEKED
jgi:membrane-bound ClpP family serine protease